MACKEIKIDDKTVKIAANGSTILIYEDTFKGRRFLQDLEEIQKTKNSTDIPLITICRIIWATAKTADNSIADIFNWSAQFSTNGLFGASKEAMELINNDIKPTSKN